VFEVVTVLANTCRPYAVDSIHHLTLLSSSSMPLDFFLKIIGAPMLPSFAATLIIIVAIAALIILAAKLVTKRTDRQRQGLDDEVWCHRRSMAFATPMPAHKGGRRAHLSPLHVAPYGASKPAQHVRSGGYPIGSSDGDAVPDLLAAGLILGAIGSDPTTRRRQSYDSDYPIGMEAAHLPHGTNLGSVKSTGSYSPPVEGAHLTLSSSPSFCSNDSY